MTFYVFCIVFDVDRIELKILCTVLDSVYPSIIPLLPENANFGTKNFTMHKVYTDKGGMKFFYHSLSACMGNNPRALARELSPRTGGQTII